MKNNKIIINSNCSVLQSNNTLRIQIDKSNDKYSGLKIPFCCFSLFVITLITLITLLMQNYFNNPFASSIFFSSISILFLGAFLNGFFYYLSTRKPIEWYIDKETNTITKQKKLKNANQIKHININEIEYILHVSEEVHLTGNPHYLSLILKNNKKIKIYRESIIGGFDRLGTLISKFLDKKLIFKVHFKKTFILFNITCFWLASSIILLSIELNESNILGIIIFLLFIIIIWIIGNIWSIITYIRAKRNPYTYKRGYEIL